MFIPSRPDRLPWRPRRPTVPHAIRRPFAVAGISAFVAWSVTGLFLSLIPSFVIVVLDHDNLAVAGAVMALMLATSTVAQLLGHGFRSLPTQTLGLAVMILAVLGLIAAVIAKSLPVLLVASILAGVGQGLAFMGSLADVSEMAPEERKGDIVASYYVLVYAATAVPAVGVGVLAELTSLTTAFLAFGASELAICLLGLAGLTRELRAGRAA
jgi:MFS family permease